MPRTPARVDMTVQSSDMHDLYVALKGVEGNLRVSLRRRLVASVRPVVSEVKTAASFSTRIPKSVKTRVSFAAKHAQVKIYADRRIAPEAAPLEHGGRAGTFRHPVFGDRNVWSNQPAHPTFYPTINAHRDQISAEIAKVLDDVATEAGFK